MSNDEMRNKSSAICIGKYFRIRENYWIEQIKGVLGSNLVFVCGESHVDSFMLLAESGIECKLVERGIGLDKQDMADFEDGLKYLQQHPEVLKENS